MLTFVFQQKKKKLASGDERGNPPFDTKLYMKFIFNLLDKKLGIVREQVGEMSSELKQMCVKMDRVKTPK